MVVDEWTPSAEGQLPSHRTGFSELNVSAADTLDARALRSDEGSPFCEVEQLLGLGNARRARSFRHETAEDGLAVACEEWGQDLAELGLRGSHVFACGSGFEQLAHLGHISSERRGEVAGRLWFGKSSRDLYHVQCSKRLVMCIKHNHTHEEVPSLCI
jgi:hypothetical protein